MSSPTSMRSAGRAPCPLFGLGTKQQSRAVSKQPVSDKQLVTSLLEIEQESAASEIILEWIRARQTLGQHEDEIAEQLDNIELQTQKRPILHHIFSKARQVAHLRPSLTLPGDWGSSPPGGSGTAPLPVFEAFTRSRSPDTSVQVNDEKTREPCCSCHNTVSPASRFLKEQQASSEPYEGILRGSRSNSSLGTSRASSSCGAGSPSSSRLSLVNTQTSSIRRRITKRNKPLPEHITGEVSSSSLNSQGSGYEKDTTYDDDVLDNDSSEKRQNVWEKYRSLADVMSVETTRTFLRLFKA